MARKGKITDLFDLESIEKQLQVAIGAIDTWVKAVEKGSGAKVSLKGASKPSEVSAGSEKVVQQQREQSKLAIKIAEEQKAVLSLVKQRFAAEAKLVTVQTDYNKETIKRRIETQKINKELQLQAKYEQSAPNSLERVRALRAKIRAEVDKTNITETKRISVLNQQIDKLNAIEKKYVDQGRQQSLNVGNYQGSAKIIVEAMERARAKVAEVGRQFGEASPEARNARGEFEALSRITGEPKFLNISAKVGDTTSELRFFIKQLNSLEDAGLKNSDVYKDLQLRLAQLTDQLADTKQEVKALSSDSRTFDLFAGSVSFVADSFQTAAGAAVLFGASEEDVQTSTRNLLAIQSVANGVKGIANELTTKGTAANKAFAFVQGLVTTAMDKTALSAKRLNAALGLIGIAITVIGAIAIAFDVFRRKLSETEKAQQRLNDINQKAIDSYAEQTLQVETLVAKIKDENTTNTEKQQILKTVNKEYGEFVGELTDVNQLETIFVESAPDIINSLELRAKAQAAYALAVEETKKELQAQLFLETVSGDDRFSKIIRKAGEKQLKEAKTAKDNLLGLYQNFNTELADATLKASKGASLFNIGNLSGKAISEADKKRKEELDKAQAEADKLKQLADANAQAIFDINALQKQRAIDFNDEIAADEKRSLEERLAADQISYNNKLDLIIKNAELQKKLGKKTAKELELVEANKNDAIIRLDHENEEKRLGIIKEVNEKLKEAREKAIQEEQDHKLAQHDIELQNIQNQYDLELIKLDEKFADGLIKEQAYNDEKFRLQQKFNRSIIEENIKFATAQIAIAKSIRDVEVDPAKRKKQTDDIAKAENDLAALQIKLVGLVVEAKQYAKNRTKKLSDEEKAQILKDFDEIRQYSEITLQFIGGIIDAISQKEKNRIEGQLSELEKKKAKDIEIANQTIADEQKKAAAIAVIEARAAAQKELLERKQRQLDERKARFEKAAAIFRLSLALAEAIATLNVLKIIAATAQLAIAIATPIPKYKEGIGFKNDESHPGGPAIVGDGGKHEGIMYPDGTVVKSPSTSTLMYLPKGTKVHPDYGKMMVKATLTDLPGSEAPVVIDNSDIVKGLKNVTAAIEKIPQPNITVQNVLKQRIKYGHSINEHITRNIGK